MSEPQVLIPYVNVEAISVQTAAKIAGKSAGTIRNWCVTHSIGRRVGNGPFLVSRIALAAFLDGDTAGLRDYLAGDRFGSTVYPYFLRLNINPDLYEA